MRARVVYRGTVLLGAIALAWAAASPAFATPPLSLGFAADPALTSGSSSSIPWIERAKTDGASFVRVNVLWSRVAPEHPPAGFVASNPASPGYNWSSVDAAVRDLSSHGIQVVLTLYNAPQWAEDGKPYRGIQPGSWHPDSKKFGQFATAAALRYNGSFPDPSNPSTTLPRVHYWQAWNEPNLLYYLSPQWTKSHHHWTVVSTGIYRALLNSFYSAVKQVSSSNFVLMAGTAPYGDLVGSDPRDEQRTQPVTFYQGLFCLSSRDKPYKCPATPHLNALDHHPYGVGGPNWHAINAGDVAVPDIYKITRVLKAAVKSRHVLPGGSKRIWVSEMGWSSKPPNHKGVPVNKDARWYEQAFYVLWKQGVRMVAPIGIRDPAVASANVFEGGLYYYDGTAKPILTAYQFPFITHRVSKKDVLAWGRSPQPGTLSIQALRSGHWKTLHKLSVGRHQVFSIPVAFRGRGTLRGVIGSYKSLTWSQSG